MKAAVADLTSLPRCRRSQVCSDDRDLPDAGGFVALNDLEKPIGRRAARSGHPTARNELTASRYCGKRQKRVEFPL
jgi:hypothetical protein